MYTVYMNAMQYNINISDAQRDNRDTWPKVRRAAHKS